CLGKDGGTVAGIAELWRTLGAALAGYCALRGYEGSRAHVWQGCTAALCVYVSGLCDSRVQRGFALRPVCAGSIGGRFDAAEGATMAVGCARVSHAGPAVR